MNGNKLWTNSPWDFENVLRDYGWLLSWPRWKFLPWEYKNQVAQEYFWCFVQNITYGAFFPLSFCQKIQILYQNLKVLRNIDFWNSLSSYMLKSMVALKWALTNYPFFHSTYDKNNLVQCRLLGHSSNGFIQKITVSGNLFIPFL